MGVSRGGWGLGVGGSGLHSVVRRWPRGALGVSGERKRFFVVSTITCPRTGSVHKVARRLMNFKGIDADHPQTQRNYFKVFVNKYQFFLINCLSSVVALVVLPQFVQSPLFFNCGP